MNMSSLKLNTSLKQHMVLTPQLRQRIEMLQMTSLELNDLVQQELVANPVLEEVTNDEESQEISEHILDQNFDGTDETFESGAADKLEIGSTEIDPELTSIVGSTELLSENGFSPVSTPTGDDEPDAETPLPEKGDAFEDVDFGSEFRDYLDPGYKTQELEYREDAPTFEQFLTHAESLSEHLETQIRLQSLEEDIAEAAVCIIGNLDEDGRLVASSEELAEMCETSIEVIEKARVLVLSLDPVGCGARNVRECLLAQLEAGDEGNSLAATLVRDHFEDLQPHRLQHLVKSVGVDMDCIVEELKVIRALDPFPGRRFNSQDPMYVSPEVYIEKIEGDYVIYFADDGSPRLRISSTYQKLLGADGTSKETRDFIKEKMRSAVDLLRNIEHRKHTIYRVVERILERQRDFLDHGVQHLKPMMLKDVAEDIGMHLSTVSRVVNRKYAHTPQGVIELRRFFSEGMLNEEGEEVSTRIVKLRIKKLIEEEDTHKPITDDDIVKILSSEGIKLSRRTVAKYRDQMHIKGSRERKTVV